MSGFDGVEVKAWWSWGVWRKREIEQAESDQPLDNVCRYIRWNIPELEGFRPFVTFPVLILYYGMVCYMNRTENADILDTVDMFYKERKDRRDDGYESESREQKEKSLSTTKSEQSKINED